MVKYGSPMMVSSGYVAQVDETLCDACGTCVDACPIEAPSLGEVSVVSWAKCMGCDVYVGNALQGPQPQYEMSGRVSPSVCEWLRRKRPPDIRL